MADRVVPGPVNDDDCIKEAVCVNTRKIMDSCRDKDCIEDLRVYPTLCSQAYIESAFSVRPRSAELLHCKVSVNEICLNRGYYTVDVTYFYKITGETFPANQVFTGLAVFDKRVMLFGSEGRVKTFSSDDCCVLGGANHMPFAEVDAVDPIALHMTLADAPLPEPGIEQREIPREVSDSLARSWPSAAAAAMCTLRWGSFRSSASSAAPSSSSPHMITACPTRSAWAPPRMIPAPCSDASASLSRSSSRPTALSTARITSPWYKFFPRLRRGIILYFLITILSLSL